jgi:hypothetical protein
MAIVSATLAAIVLVMMVPGFLLYRALVERLRSRHTGVWDDLHRPGLVFYGSLVGQQRFNEFVRRRRYRDLGDPQLTRIADVYRNYARVYTLVFAAAAVTLALAGLGVGVI